MAQSASASSAPNSPGRVGRGSASNATGQCVYDAGMSSNAARSANRAGAPSASGAYPAAAKRDACSASAASGASRSGRAVPAASSAVREIARHAPVIVPDRTKGSNQRPVPRTRPPPDVSPVAAASTRPCRSAARIQSASQPDTTGRTPACRRMATSTAWRRNSAARPRLRFQPAPRRLPPIIRTRDPSKASAG